MTDVLTDREAIADQVARYAHCFDSHDIEGWVALFTEDGVFEVSLIESGERYVRLEGAEQLRAFATGSPPVLHHISSLVFDEFDQDSARTRAAVLGTWSSPEDGSPAIFTHGTYEQRWAKVEGAWRIAHLLFRSHGYSTAMDRPAVAIS
jgi:3-phenylpropionate/cinnamic acid dioxygenase small subunit